MARQRSHRPTKVEQLWGIVLQCVTGRGSIASLAFNRRPVSESLGPFFPRIA